MELQFVLSIVVRNSGYKFGAIFSEWRTKPYFTRFDDGDMEVVVGPFYFERWTDADLYE